MAGLPGEGATFGRYDVGRRIGRGGMGVVYEATHRDLQRRVALKLLSMDLLDNEALRKRFIREAQALAAVDSPMIVPVFDAGEHEGWLYIATKLFPDGDLGDWIQAHGALTREESISVLAQVAEGLADAHEAGFLHRDIKPSNILLQRRPDGLRAVICDFGIAFAAGSEHTKTVGVIGTLGYMAPERHEGHPATVASDIYGLGCVLYACLMGQAPWVGTDVKVAMGHLYDPVPQLPEGPDALNRLLARALAKDPDSRFRSAGEFRAALLGLDDVDDSTVVVDFVPEEPPVLGSVRSKLAAIESMRAAGSTAEVAAPTDVRPFATEVVAVPGSHIPVPAPDPTSDETVLGSAPVTPTVTIGSDGTQHEATGRGGRRRWLVGAAAALLIGGLALRSRSSVVMRTTVRVRLRPRPRHRARVPRPRRRRRLRPVSAPSRSHPVWRPAGRRSAVRFARHPCQRSPQRVSWSSTAQVSGVRRRWRRPPATSPVVSVEGGEQVCILVRAYSRHGSAAVFGPSGAPVARARPRRSR